ncbi:ATP-dependent DNA helicase [Durusdinium trenchii]|uniref:ATP-dependent DNA helicase n=1 Tax=Durusdinium trenchii TaxID=1381693 RepID=A0ABP0JQX6_9DINO
MLGPIAHLRSLTRRVESSIRNSWDLVSSLRRLTFKWHSVWNTPLWRKELLETTPLHEWVQAAKALYHKLQKGTYLTAGNHIKPINYDARKLWFASNLTQPEIQLLRDIRQAQQLLPGTVEVRRRIGRFLFGARVHLGEPIFITVSPTTRHNAVCLKMSRYRANDPGAGHCCAKDDPKVWEDTTVTIPVPDYETRRCSAVRDPWCVNVAFQSMIGFVFAELLGAVSLGEIFEYQQWLHNESHLNLEQHVALEPDLETEWKQNFVGKQHDKLCLWLAFVAADTEPSPWTAPSSHFETLLRDATTYRTKYASAVQERLSHQQHHIHVWDPKHKCAVPLPGCRKKNAPNKCKHGFPKALCDTARVICRGNARQFPQSTAGRRNGL